VIRKKFKALALNDGIELEPEIAFYLDLPSETLVSLSSKFKVIAR